MTQRCNVCNKGYMEPPKKGSHFYECNRCDQEIFIDDFPGEHFDVDIALGKLVMAAIRLAKTPQGELPNKLNSRIQDYQAALIRSLAFPGKERDQWSSEQITSWLAKQAEQYTDLALSDDDVKHFNAQACRKLADKFPSMLRKMWSSVEVHEWLEQTADDIQVHFD